LFLTFSTKLPKSGELSEKVSFFFIDSCLTLTLGDYVFFGFGFISAG
jgi:hypothetical protein